MENISVLEQYREGGSPFVFLDERIPFIAVCLECCSPLLPLVIFLYKNFASAICWLRLHSIFLHPALNTTLAAKEEAGEMAGVGEMLSHGLKK